jgi:hypothetical protein
MSVLFQVMLVYFASKEQVTFPEYQMENCRCGVLQISRVLLIYKMKFHFSVFHLLSSWCIKKTMPLFTLFSVLFVMRKKKYIALFEGCRDSPACPSNKKSIRIKMRMGSGGMILRGENRSTRR